MKARADELVARKSTSLIIQFPNLAHSPSLTANDASVEFRNKGSFGEFVKSPSRRRFVASCRGTAHSGHRYKSEAQEHDIVHRVCR